MSTVILLYTEAICPISSWYLILRASGFRLPSLAKRLMLFEITAIGWMIRRRTRISRLTSPVSRISAIGMISQRKLFRISRFSSITLRSIATMYSKLLLPSRNAWNQKVSWPFRSEPDTFFSPASHLSSMFTVGASDSVPGGYFSRSALSFSG